MTITLGAPHPQQDATSLRPACEATRADFGAYYRAELPAIRAKRVSVHLECCRPCTAIYHAGFRMFD